MYTVTNLTNTAIAVGNVYIDTPQGSKTYAVLDAAAQAAIRAGGLLSCSPALPPIVGLIDNTGGTVSTTLAAITAGGTYAQADIVAIKNALASINSALTGLLISQQNDVVMSGVNSKNP